MEGTEAACMIAATRDASISPPPSKRRRVLQVPEMPCQSKPTMIDLTSPSPSPRPALKKTLSRHTGMRIIPSPIQLNFVAEFPASSNKDTTGLGSILGNPLISECWLFNYRFDIDFIM